VVPNLAILLLIAVALAALALALFRALGRIERRAHWGREDGVRRGQRLERRAFVVGLALVLALAGGLAASYLARRPGCTGTIIIVRGPDGEPLECACERGRRGACWSPGP
jgi:hypothetical protein